MLPAEHWGSGPLSRGRAACLVSEMSVPLRSLVRLDPESQLHGSGSLLCTWSGSRCACACITLGKPTWWAGQGGLAASGAGLSLTQLCWCDKGQALLTGERTQKAQRLLCALRLHSSRPSKLWVPATCGPRNSDLSQLPRPCRSDPGRSASCVTQPDPGQKGNSAMKTRG